MEEGDRAALCGGGNDRSPHEELAHAPGNAHPAGHTRSPANFSGGSRTHRNLGQRLPPISYDKPPGNRVETKLGVSQKGVATVIRKGAVIPLTEGDAALDTLEGMVNSYVRGPRGRKRGATLSGVYGQVERARRAGKPEEMIRDRVRKGMTDPPHADLGRIDDITCCFLK